MNMIEKRRAQAGQGGFTLIELLVVIAILAVLAGLAVIGIGAMRGVAENKACEADKDTYATAAEAKRIADNSSNYPDEAAMLASNYLKKQSKFTIDVDTNGNVTGTCPS